MGKGYYLFGIAQPFVDYVWPRLTKKEFIKLNLGLEGDRHLEDRVSDIWKFFGKHYRGKKPQKHVGGTVTNTLLNVAAANKPVKYVGSVGDDEDGALIRQEIEHQPLVDSFLPSIGPTGELHVIRTRGKNDRTMVAKPGGSVYLPLTTPETLDLKCDLASSMTFYTTLFELFCNNLGRRTEEFMEIAQMDHRMPIFMGSADHHSLQAKEGEVLRILKKYRPVFICNTKEIFYLLGYAKAYKHIEDEERGTRSNKMIESAMKELSSFTQQRLFVTDGEHGSYFYDPSGKRKETKFQRTRAYKPRSIKVVNATGAGDAYAAGVIIASLDGQKPKVQALCGDYVAAGAISAISNVGLGQNGFGYEKMKRMYYKKD